jgi:hypothetical protein
VIWLVRRLTPDDKIVVQRPRFCAARVKTGSGDHVPSTPFHPPLPSATERVVSFLLAFSRRNERNGQDPSDFELPMTRADIGDFLGLTIETVSRTFTKLRTLGLIELPLSNRVKLVDIDELKTLADGDDH